MKQRVITALLIILAVIPIFFSIKYLYLILSFVVLVAAYELNKLIDKEVSIPIYLATLAFISLFGFNLILVDQKLLIISIFLLVFVLFDLVYKEINFKDLALVYSISLLFGFAINSIISLYATNLSFLFYILLVTYGSDSGAYLVGSSIGKNKLIPHISPNKTIEGAIGGVVFGAVLGSVFGYFFLSDHIDFIILVIISTTMPIITQIGDLFFSSIKRLYNIKDYSNIFPGHGGVIDRVDSLIFALVFMAVVINLNLIGGIV